MTDIRSIVTAARFTPTEAQIRYKTEFWNSAVGNVPPECSIDQLIELGASGRIRRWEKIPGFPEWFANKDSNKQRSEELLIRAMDRLSEILRDADDHSVLLAAAKEARNLHAQLNAVDKAEEKFADEEISKMSKEQLAEFIAKQTGSK